MKFKSELVVIILVVIILLAISQYVLLPVWFRDAGVEIFGWLIMLSVGGAIALSLMVINSVVKKIIKINHFSGVIIGSRLGAQVGAYGSYPFALFLGFVVGGNFGGSIGGNITYWLSLGKSGIIIGIGFRIFIVTIVICTLGSFIGAYIGCFINKSFHFLRK